MHTGSGKDLEFDGTQTDFFFDLAFPSRSLNRKQAEIETTRQREWSD